MQIIRNAKKAQDIILKAKRKGKKIGFVPTMGAFHEGHLSLMRKCRRENNLAIVSIFVNPKQFGPKADLSSYPRQQKKDVLLAKKENIDIILYPSEENIYPDRYLTYIEVKKITNTLCGKFRPGHFTGVATIVAKLLNIIPCDTLYLGQKDAQQSVIIKQMIQDLNFPCKVKVLKTVREKDGLAMSSRNKYLTQSQRREATILYQALKDAKNKILTGEKNPRIIERMISSKIKKCSSGRIQYIQCVDASSLESLKHLKGHVLIALAVYFGKARWIDNVVLNLK